ncbi:hypothetical protein AKJ16_DCAP16314, partial [Drosera capensis]
MASVLTKQLVPGIRNPGKAPMATIHQFGFSAGIDRRVTIFPQLGEECDVEQIHWLLHFTHYALDYLFSMVGASWVGRTQHWLSLALAALDSRLTPFTSTVEIKSKTISDYRTFGRTEKKEDTKQSLSLGFWL